MTAIALEFLTDLHVQDLARIASNPLISKTSGVPPDCDESVVRSWVIENGKQTPDEITFTITVDQNVAGCCILKKVDWETRHAELAYWLGVDFWGRGIATSAVMAMRDFAFDCYSLACLQSHYLRDSNAASGQILKKLGFVADRTRDELPVSGRFQELAPDVWTFVRLDWEKWRSEHTNSSWSLQVKA
ncbi:MAG: GNAT family N-acetyltransferase [Chloroflexota bacterium]